MVEFDAQKIRNAIFKANVAVAEEEMTGTALDELTSGWPALLQTT